MSAVNACHWALIATTSAQVRCVRPATGIADPATLLPLRVAMPSSVGPCRRSRDPHRARRTAQPVPVRHQEISRRRPERLATPWISPDDGPADQPGASGVSLSAGDAPRLTLSRDGTVRTLRTQRNTSWSRLERPSRPAGAPACVSVRDASQAIRRCLRSVGDAPSTSRSRNMFQVQRVARSASRVCGTL